MNNNKRTYLDAFDKEEEEKNQNSTFAMTDERIRLNVGGTYYTTLKSTLAAFPQTLLGRMFSSSNASLLKPDKEDCYFFDRNGRLFEHVLDFYRTRRLYEGSCDEDCQRLVDEYEFWGLIAPPPAMLFGYPFDEKTLKIVKELACEESRKINGFFDLEFVISGTNFYAFFDCVKLITSVTDRDCILFQKNGACAKTYSHTHQVGIHCCIPESVFDMFRVDPLKTKNNSCYVCAQDFFEILAKFLTCYSGETYQYALRCRKKNKFLFATLYFADVGDSKEEVQRISLKRRVVQDKDSQHHLGFPKLSLRSYQTLCLPSAELSSVFNVFNRIYSTEKNKDDQQITLSISQKKGLLIAVPFDKQTRQASVGSKYDIKSVEHEMLLPECGAVDLLVPKDEKKEFSEQVFVHVTMKRQAMSNFIGNMSRISSNTIFCTLSDSVCEFPVVISHRIGAKDEIHFDIYFK